MKCSIVNVNWSPSNKWHHNNDDGIPQATSESTKTLFIPYNNYVSWTDNQTKLKRRVLVAINNHEGLKSRVAIISPIFLKSNFYHCRKPTLGFIDVTETNNMTEQKKKEKQCHWWGVGIQQLGNTPKTKSTN